MWRHQLHQKGTLQSRISAAKRATLLLNRQVLDFTGVLHFFTLIFTSAFVFLTWGGMGSHLGKGGRRAILRGALAGRQGIFSGSGIGAISFSKPLCSCFFLSLYLSCTIILRGQKRFFWGGKRSTGAVHNIDCLDCSQRNQQLRAAQSRDGFHYHRYAFP